MNYPFFAFMARLKYIARWGLMRNSIPENDAEHTLQTVMIAHALAVIRRDIFHEEADPERCAALALYHDASEVFTGELRESYRPYVADMEKDPSWPLAKAADTMSAYLKCAEEIQSGNSEFHEAFESTGEKLKALHLKEVDWFLDHFAGSFSETLDEMNLHIK